MWVNFNINETIKVKLTDKGYQLLSDNHNRFVGKIPNFNILTLEDFKERADNKGYTKFQMWTFIEEFGAVTRMGMDEHYHMNIVIELKDKEDIREYKLNQLLKLKRNE